MNELYECETKHVTIKLYDDCFDIQTRWLFKKSRIEKKVYYKDIEALGLYCEYVQGVPQEGCYFDIPGESRLYIGFGISKKERAELKKAFIILKEVRANFLMREWERQ